MENGIAAVEQLSTAALDANTVAFDRVSHLIERHPYVFDADLSAVEDRDQMKAIERRDQIVLRAIEHRQIQIERLVAQGVHERQQVADMVEMQVRQHNGVERRQRNVLLQTCERAAAQIERDRGVAVAQQIAAGCAAGRRERAVFS